MRKYRVVVWKFRSVYEIKVTVTDQFNMTLRYPKMHPYTRFDLPSSNKIMRFALDTIMPHSVMTLRCIRIPNIGFLPRLI